MVILFQTHLLWLKQTLLALLMILAQISAPHFQASHLLTPLHLLVVDPPVIHRLALHLQAPLCLLIPPHLLVPHLLVPLLMA